MTITINIPGGGGTGGGTGPLHEFKVNDMDETTTANVLYVGKEDSDGEFIIQKLDDTGSTTLVTYATNTNNATVLDYATAWTNRLTLTYSQVSGS